MRATRIDNRAAWLLSLALAPCTALRAIRRAARLALGLVPVLLALVYAGALRTATAQVGGDERLVHALARVSVGEAGFRAHETGDAAAISHLLLRRAERLEIAPLAMVRAYSGRHLTRTDRKRWIAGLRLDGARPDGWPEPLSWARHRPLWLDVVELVRGVLEGGVADPCGGRAEHWGAPWWRREHVGLVEVDCGATRNAYWATAGERS